MTPQRCFLLLIKKESAKNEARLTALFIKAVASEKPLGQNNLLRALQGNSGHERKEFKGQKHKEARYQMFAPISLQIFRNRFCLTAGSIKRVGISILLRRIKSLKISSIIMNF